MKILISGGYGYVGNFIAQYFDKLGHEIIIGSRKKRAESDFQFRPLFLDETLNQTATFKDIDIFIHAAFDHLPGKYRGGEGDDPDQFIERNLNGTIALFEHAKKAGVKHTIFLSSRAVYGAQKPGALLYEDMQCFPDTLYGEVKLKAEQSLSVISDQNFRATSLRITGVFGIPYFDCPDLDFGELPLEKYLQNQSQHMLSQSEEWHKWQDLFQSYLDGELIAPRIGTEIHGTEVAKAIAKILSAPTNLTNGEVFNLSHFMLDRYDLLKELKQQTGCKHQLPSIMKDTDFNKMSDTKFRGLR